MCRRMKFLLASLLAISGLAPASIAAGEPEATQVRISWDKVIRESKTTATFQIVANPMLRRGGAICWQGRWLAITGPGKAIE